MIEKKITLKEFEEKFDFSTTYKEALARIRKIGSKYLDKESMDFIMSKPMERIEIDIYRGRDLVNWVDLTEAHSQYRHMWE